MVGCYVGEHAVLAIIELSIYATLMLIALVYTYGLGVVFLPETYKVDLFF